MKTGVTGTPVFVCRLQLESPPPLILPLHRDDRERLVARRPAVGHPVARLRIVDHLIHRAVLLRLHVGAEDCIRRRGAGRLPDVGDDDGGDRALVVVVDAGALPVGEDEEVLRLILFLRVAEQLPRLALARAELQPLELGVERLVGRGRRFGLLRRLLRHLLANGAGRAPGECRRENERSRQQAGRSPNENTRHGGFLLTWLFEVGLTGGGLHLYDGRRGVRVYRSACTWAAYARGVAYPDARRAQPTSEALSSSR